MPKSAREVILAATTENFKTWGFDVTIAPKSGGAAKTVKASGRMASTEMTPDGVVVILPNPFIEILRRDIDFTPVKGDKVETPADFMAPEGAKKNWLVEDAPRGVKNWVTRLNLVEIEA